MTKTSPTSGTGSAAPAQFRPMRRAKMKLFCVATVALLLLTVVAWRVEDSSQLQWTGPVVPRAIKAVNAVIFLHARATGSPYIENFLIVEHDGRTDLVFSSDPDFGRRVLRLLDLGLPAPVGAIGSSHRSRGVWFSSVVTTRWWIRDPDNMVLMAAERQRVHAASALAGDPPRQVRVTAWVVLDALGVVLLGVWLWLLTGAVRARWRRPRPGCCARCGYDRAGLGGGVCPECGTAPGGDAS